MTTEARVQMLHPDPDKSAPRIDRAVYDATRAAILAAAGDDDGVAFGDLSARVKATAPAAVFEGRSVGWYTTVVKLDLEARGLLARLPGRGPQRLKATG